MKYQTMRSPWKVWLAVLFSLGIYGWYWWYNVGHDLDEYLETKKLHPTRDLIITIFCGLYFLYLPLKYGRAIYQAQKKAQVPDAANRGITFLGLMPLFGYGYASMQKELNRIWSRTHPET